MSEMKFNNNIDPAITGPSSESAMPPPPAPGFKSSQGQSGFGIPRRGTRRDLSAPSMVSVNSIANTDSFSQAELPSKFSTTFNQTVYTSFDTLL
jgi:hypothetical protein